MKLKKVLQTTISLAAVVLFSLGFIMLDVFSLTPASANSSTAEWYTGNSQVTATLGYKFDESEYYTNNWYYGAVTEYTDLATCVADLKKEGFWTEEDYANMDRTPLFYQTKEGATNPSINLGYYSGDFMMASHAVHSIKADTTTGDTTRFANFDYQGLVYTFTDLETGNYFNLKVYSKVSATNSTLQRGYIQISYNGGDYSEDKLTYYYFGGQYRQSAGNAASETFHFLNIKYDKDSNSIKHSSKLTSVIKLSDLGIPAFNNYKVDMEFLSIRTGRTAGLMVYFLNGYDLNDIENASELNGTDKVLYTKTKTLKLNDLEASVSDIVGVWNSVNGNIETELSVTVTDVLGADVPVTNGKFAAKSGTYTVVASLDDGQSITANVEITAPNATDVPHAEWATGNDQVTATFNYDLKNSEYGANNWYYGAVTENTDLATCVADLKKEGFWTEEDYYKMNFKPLFYQTVEGATNPSINLGYYSGDFMMASHAVHSIKADTTTGDTTRFANFDYQGLIYTFTDLETGNYFNLKVYSKVSATNSTLQRGYIQISYNGGDYSEDKLTYYYFGGQYRQSAGNAASETFHFLNIKYDKDSNSIKHSSKLNNEIKLSELGIPAFNNYKVDMEFLSIRTGRTAGLMVYFLNGYELHNETKYTLVDKDHKDVIFGNDLEVTATANGKVALTDTVKVWNNYVGFVSEKDIKYSVKFNDNDVTVSNGAFEVSGVGEYTVTATYGENLTKEIAINVSYPDGGVVIKKARLSLDGKIGVQFLVSVDATQYDLEGGKAVFTIAGETIEVPFTSWAAEKTTLDENDYVVECKVAAKQMTDDISVKAINKDGVETLAINYTVKEYAKAILQSQNSSKELVELVKALLNYGAYAQTYFDYNTDNLANAEIFDGENPVETLVPEFNSKITVNGAVEGVTFKSLSLALESTTDIYVLFAFDGVEMQDAVIKNGETILEKIETTGGCYVIIPNIAAKDIDEQITISVEVGQEVVSYAFSARVYLTIAYDKTGDTAYDNLLKAIELYNVAANEYFASVE